VGVRVTWLPDRGLTRLVGRERLIQVDGGMGGQYRRDPIEIDQHRAGAWRRLSRLAR
jgi:hypothetical protein